MQRHGFAEADNAADDADDRHSQHRDGCLADLDVLQDPAPEKECQSGSKHAVVEQAEDGFFAPDDRSLRHGCRVDEQRQGCTDHLPRRQGNRVDIRQLELDEDACEAPEDGAQ